MSTGLSMLKFRGVSRGSDARKLEDHPVFYRKRSHPAFLCVIVIAPCDAKFSTLVWSKSAVYASWRHPVETRGWSTTRDSSPSVVALVGLTCSALRTQAGGVM